MRVKVKRKLEDIVILELINEGFGNNY